MFIATVLTTTVIYQMEYFKSSVYFNIKIYYRLSAITVEIVHNDVII